MSEFGKSDYALPILMFLGSLGDAEFEAVINGRARLDLGMLRPDQVQFVREITGYRSLVCERLPSPDLPAPDLLLTGSEASPEPGLSGAVLRSQRSSTRAVVNAEMRRRTYDVALNNPMTVLEVASLFPSIAGGLDLSAAMDGRYLVGRQDLVEVQILLRPGIARTFVIRAEFRPESGPLRFADLPEDVRRAFGAGG